MSDRLRVFDENGRFVRSVGRFVRSVGRSGDGPGEYGWLTHILPHVADSIAVMDNEVVVS